MDLTPIDIPALVGTTIARSLGIREGGGRPPEENLRDTLADKEILLILDNFEQIVSAAPLLADTPLAIWRSTGARPAAPGHYSMRAWRSSAPWATGAASPNAWQGWRVWLPGKMPAGRLACSAQPMH